MAFPLLLALGLMGGQQMLKLRREEAREQETANAVKSLLGGAPGEMGPPTEGGQMGYTGGRGLLADPTDPLRQLQFAAGIMGTPRMQDTGSQLLNAAMQRGQQGQQFQQQLGQQQQQFGATEARLVDQFKQTFGLDKQRFQASRDDQATAVDRWFEEFQATQRDRAARLGIDQQRLGLDQQRLGLERDKATDKASALPELPKGWMYTKSAAGLVAAPVPGTEDYAKAVGGDERAQQAVARVGQLLDLVGGKEEVTPAGKKVRVGGAGGELWGQTAAQMSTIRGQIIADVAQMREMGVLQAGELANLEKQLPDPSSWGSVLRRNDSTLKAYEELRDQMRQKAERHRKANPWLVPPPPQGARVVP